MGQEGPVMTDNEKEFAADRDAGSRRGPMDYVRSCRQLGLGVVVALACCGVLASVWRAAADENRGQAIAAVKALETSPDSAGRIEAIRDVVRSMVIDVPIVIPPLIRALSDPVVDVRVEAARSLGPATSAAAFVGSDGKLAQAGIAALQRSLEDQESAVRIAAVYSLGSIAASKDPSKVIDPQNLVDALAAMLDDRDATVRASTIAALGVAGPAAAADPPPALLAALDDESCFNRAASVRALARFPQGLDDHLIPKLLGVLEREPDDSPVREACVEVLRHIHTRRGGDTAFSALRAGLMSRDRQVRSLGLGSTH
jgi:HEAT repeat protein